MVKDGTIVLKLFNLVAKDIGPMFLAQGVWVNGKDISDFFGKRRSTSGKAVTLSGSAAWTPKLKTSMTLNGKVDGSF